VEVVAGLVPVTEATDVAEARRRASDAGRTIGMDAVTLGRLAIIASELATNQLKHAGGGEFFFGPAGTSASPGVQMLAMDRGPGIPDMAASLVDGFSTAGTSGTGLGAVRRNADTFGIDTSVKGTVVAAAVFATRPVAPLPAAGVCVPMRGERESGDAWAAWSAGDLTSVFVVDGLGHGSEAARAAAAAVDTFLRHAERSAADVIALVHAALRTTRGAAVALAELDQRSATLRYCAVGNIAAIVSRLDGSEQHLVTLPGIAGHVSRRVQTFTYAWPRGSILVMHSDGVGTHWSPAQYAGSLHQDPAALAGAIYRDHRRGTDDATVVVARHGQRA
jgi:anti-sigma regulatory factor (Ser/Thr protein kinase)